MPLHAVGLQRTFELPSGDAAFAALHPSLGIPVDPYCEVICFLAGGVNVMLYSFVSLYGIISNSILRNDPILMNFDEIFTTMTSLHN